MLRHQLAIIRRSHHRAPNLRPSDRITLGLIAQLINPNRLRAVAIIVRPATLLKFHRALVKRKYRTLFGQGNHRRPGPIGPSKELIDAIIQIKRHNPRFGCPRIAETLSSTFGIDVNKDVVRRVLARHYKPDPDGNKGPSWLTFLGHSKDSLWSIDFFRCESLTLNSYWVIVVMDQWSRSIVGFGVHQGDVDGISLCAALVPRPRHNLVRYHGIFAPNANMRQLIVPKRNRPIEKVKKGNEKHKAAADPANMAELYAPLTWAQRLKRVFNLDIVSCPMCGGNMRVIADITDPEVIQKILDHINAQPPPLNPRTAIQSWNATE